jgi:hypothetical protein
VGAEPFFVHLADDLIRSEVACLRQMAEVYEAKRASVLGVQVVPRRDTEKYGIVAVEADKSATSRVRSIIEKPKPADAPSNLAVVGRYVLMPSIFEHLEKLGHGAGGEIQLTDGIAALMREEAVYAHRFTGKRYDCGSKLGYLQATVEFALGHPQLGREFSRYLLSLSRATINSIAAKGNEYIRSDGRPANGAGSGSESQGDSVDGGAEQIVQAAGDGKLARNVRLAGGGKAARNGRLAGGGKAARNGKLTGSAKLARDGKAAGRKKAKSSRAVQAA